MIQIVISLKKKEHGDIYENKTIAMARTAWYRGAEVKLVLGPVEGTGTLHGLEVRRVVSALEMYDAVMEESDWASCVVKAAAVGDYRAREVADRKSVV